QHVIDVIFHGRREIRDRLGRLFTDAGAIHGPSLVAVENVDNIAFFGVVGAVFVGVAPIILEVDEAHEFAGMSELRPAPGAFAFTNFEVGRAAQGFSQLVENLTCLGDALFGQNGGRILPWAHRSNGRIV